MGLYVKALKEKALTVKSLKKIVSNLLRFKLQNNC